MATVPTPRTWVNGDTPTGSMLNENLREAFEFLMNPPRVHVYNSTALFSDGTHTLLTWDTEVYDTDGMHNGSNPSRLTAVTTGIYEITLHVEWEIVNEANGGNRYVMIQKNNSGGTTPDTSAEIGIDSAMIGNNESVGPQTNHLVIFHHLTAGDYIEALARATGDGGNVDTIPGGGLGARTFFAARWMGTT